jgi:hypothetical protein
VIAVGFEVPEDVRVFPLDDPPEELADIAAAYGAAHVAYAATLVRRRDDRLTVGHFTVTIEPFEEVDPLVAAHAIAEILEAQPDRLRAVAPVRLPCGPAVAMEELWELAARDGATAVSLAASHVFVRPAGGPGLVVLTIATPAVRDLALWTQELAVIAGSLRFTPSSTAGQLEAAPAR